MICVSLGQPSLSECLEALGEIDFAEIRLDLMDVGVADLPAIFSAGKRLIATCRPGQKSAGEREALLVECIRQGAAFVDVEHDAAADYRMSILREAKNSGSRLILSYHDYERTPPVSELDRIIRRNFRFGADYVKVACRADSPSDAARLLGLLGRPGMCGRLIVAGMGRYGRQVRVFAPFLGSPFTYASLASGMETAPGQFSIETLAAIFERLEDVLPEVPWTSTP